MNDCPDEPDRTSSTRARAPEPRRVIVVRHALPEIESGVAVGIGSSAHGGEGQARRLASELRDGLSADPFCLLSSPEPKAKRTAEIVGDALGSAVVIRHGLEELDRPVLPILSPAEP